jgi:small subunit ribosomal protein S20
MDIIPSLDANAKLDKPGERVYYYWSEIELKGVKPLPVTSSAKKRLRQSETRRLRNRVYRSRARTYVKRTKKLISEGRWDEAAEVAQLAAGALDRAAQKGVIHKRNAARRKSRLYKKLHQARAQSTS